MLQLTDVLEQIGLHVEGRRETIETLAKQPMPCIAHMGKAKHFVVVDGVANGRVHLFDCWGRRTSRKADDFVDDWSGHVLLVSRPDRGTLLPAFVSPAPKPAPRIQFEATFVDRGEIRAIAGEAVAFVYHLRNGGDRALEIKALHKRCTCIEAKYPSVPIPPGGEGVVELAFNTANREGPFFHQVLLETNDPLLPVAKLKATGYIDTGVTAHPARVELGDVGVGEERTVACIVRYAGVREEFAIGEVECGSRMIALRHFGVDTRDAAKLFWPEARPHITPGASGHVVVVTLRPTAGQIGEVRAEIVIETNLEGFERVVVPVSGRVVPPVRVYPSVLSFGEIGSDDEVERTVMALSSVSRPFRVAGTLPVHDGLRVSVGDSDDHGELAVHFTATGVAALALADEEFALVVEMTDTGERFSVPLRARRGTTRPQRTGFGRDRRSMNGDLRAVVGRSPWASGGRQPPVFASRTPHGEEGGWPDGVIDRRRRGDRVSTDGARRAGIFSRATAVRRGDGRGVFGPFGR